MTFTEEQVEWIVTEVLRRLGVAGEGKSSAPGGNELRLDDRVVTLRSIEGRLAGVTRVAVGLRAIVTPAVKDELRSKNVDLVFHQ